MEDRSWKGDYCGEGKEEMKKIRGECERKVIRKGADMNEKEGPIWRRSGKGKTKGKEQGIFEGGRR